MSVVYDAELNPSKEYLMAKWLKKQVFFDGAEAPQLTVVGGFRLDDPQDAVGMEFMIVRDQNTSTTYHLPLSYRGQPRQDSSGLIGTLEHSILGKRWVYDGPTDPVWRQAVTDLLAGEAQPQHRTESHTADLTVKLVPGTTAADVAENSVQRRVNGIDTQRALHSDLTEDPGIVISWESEGGQPVTGLVLRGAWAPLHD